MADIIEAEYDITRKSKLKVFYKTYKTLIYSFIIILIIIFASFTYYLNNKEKEKIILSEKYVQAKIYLSNDKNIKALSLLKSVIYANDPAYSTLSFFIILNENLIKDNKEISSLFNHLILNNKFNEEIKDLLIYKKALFSSSYGNETDLLEELKPLINKENSLLKPHALLLLANYFVSKKEYIKAKDFYIQILSTANLPRNFYDQAKYQLSLITNDN